MTEDELQELLEKTLPAADRHDVFVEECQDQDVRLLVSPLKPGETWSSGALLSLVDTSLRAAAGVSAALKHLNITVLKAAHDADVIALCRGSFAVTGMSLGMPRFGCSAMPSSIRSLSTQRVACHPERSEGSRAGGKRR